VTLISGPVSLSAKHPNIQVIHVQTAHEMLDATKMHFEDSEAAILTAAVADFKPKSQASAKIKKSDATLNLELEETTDILQTLGLNKRSNQILAGFALETNQGREHAELKLKNKNLDFIVLNELSNYNQVFGNDFNSIEIYSSTSGWKSFGKQTKAEAAKEIAIFLEQLFNHA
jgi:phosphopantothenoylcysteine decarboxylase/phosphopantothenate--cysteine ligase